MAVYQNHRLANPEQYSILIIDDDSDSRSLYSRRLLNEGYVVSSACDGEDATTMMSIEQYDVILLDLEMPRMNGFEFMEWLKLYKPDHNSHIIILSSLREKDSVFTALNLGAMDYVVKTSSPLELLNRIQRACLTRQMQKELPNYHHADALSDSYVYIVDDEELNRKLIAHHLGHHKITFKCFEDGHALLSEMQNRIPELILLDVMMPELDGIETLRAIREIYPPHELGIIMLSALDNPDQIEECYRLGADDYVTKPFNSAELIARVKTTLKYKQLSEEKVRLDELSLLGKNLRSH